MDAIKHTPGPWDASGLVVYDTCLDSVCTAHTAEDARLIAAAPNLLAVLRDTLAFAEALERPGHGKQSGRRGGTIFAKARAAIAKAEGRS